MRHSDSTSRFVNRRLTTTKTLPWTSGLKHRWLAHGALALACASTMQLAGCVRGSGHDLSSDLREEGSKAAIQASDEIETRKREAAIAGARTKEKTESTPAVASAEKSTPPVDSGSVAARRKANPLADFLEREQPAGAKQDPFLAQASTTREVTPKKDAAHPVADGVSQADAEWEALLESKLAIARQRSQQGAGGVASASPQNSLVQQTSAMVTEQPTRSASPEATVVSASPRPAARPFPGSMAGAESASSVTAEPVAESRRKTAAEALGSIEKESFLAGIDSQMPTWLSGGSMARSETSPLESESQQESRVTAGSILRNSPLGSGPERTPAWSQEDRNRPVGPLPEAEVVTQSPVVDNPVSLVARETPVISNSLKGSEESTTLLPKVTPSADFAGQKLLPRRDFSNEPSKEGGLALASRGVDQASASHGEASSLAAASAVDPARLRVQALMSLAHSQIDRGELQAAYRTALEAQQVAAEADIAFTADEELPARLAADVADQLWGPGLRGARSVGTSTLAIPRGAEPEASVAADPFEASRNESKPAWTPEVFASVFGSEGNEQNWRPASVTDFNQQSLVESGRNSLAPPEEDLRRNPWSQASTSAPQETLPEVPDSSGPLAPSAEELAAMSNPALMPAESEGTETGARRYRRRNNLGPIQLTNIEADFVAQGQTGNYPGFSVPLDAGSRYAASGSPDALESTLFAPPVPSELPELPEISRAASSSPATGTKNSLPVETATSDNEYGWMWAMVGFIAAAVSTVVGLRLQRQRCQEDQAAGEPVQATLQMPTSPARESAESTSTGTTAKAA